MKKRSVVGKLIEAALNIVSIGPPAGYHGPGGTELEIDVDLATNDGRGGRDHAAIIA